MRIGVVIPVYNEARWVEAAVSRVLEAPVAPTPEGWPCDRTVYAVDDGSTDGTVEILRRMGELQGVVTQFHPANRGKGAAIRTGIARALQDGVDIVVIHDADLEYDPKDHVAALAPILDGRADAVIGSRFIGQTHRVLYYWHYLANKFITTCCNMATNLNLTDVECCTKAFAASALRTMTLTEERFGIEIELVAKIAKAWVPEAAPGATPPTQTGAEGARRRRARVYEVAVNYAGRTYEEGKKITWCDGLAALACIVKHGVLG